MYRITIENLKNPEEAPRVMKIKCMVAGLLMAGSQHGAMSIAADASPDEYAETILAADHSAQITCQKYPAIERALKKFR